MGLEAGRVVSLSILLLLTSLAGCTGLASTTPIAEISADQTSINLGESVNFDARSSSTPSPSIIDEYVWDFGDGEKRRPPLASSSTLSLKPETTTLKSLFSTTVGKAIGHP